jgi:hypothetical protein
VRRRAHLDSFQPTPKRVRNEDPATAALHRAAWLFAVCFAAGLALVVFTHSVVLMALVGAGMPAAFVHMLLRATGHSWQEVAVAVQSRSQRAWSAIRHR